MKRIIKYLKPYTLAIICVIILVFFQSQSELALPDRMSNIVTYGIQFGGIEDTNVMALTADTYQKVILLSDDENISEAFDKVEANSNSKLIEKYPLLSIEDIYIRKDNINVDLTDELFIISALNNYPQDNIYQLLQDEQTKQKIINDIHEASSNLTSDNIKQVALMYIQHEYQLLGMNTFAIQMGYILKEGGYMLLIALLCSMCAIGGGYLSSKVAIASTKKLRKDVFEKVQSFSTSEYSKFSCASLITRTTNDIQQVQQIIQMLLRIVLFAPMMGIGSLIKVFRYPQMLWILALCIVIIILVFIMTFALTMPKFSKIQKTVDKINLILREFLDGMLVIRAFNTQEYEEERFDEANKAITSLNLFVNRVMSSVMPLITFIMNAITVIIVWVAATQIDKGVMEIGSMLAFIQYAMHVLMSFMIVAMISIMIPRSAISAKRIFEVLDTELSIKDPKEPKHLNDNKQIIFDHVSFKYPNAQDEVLSDISFTVDPGETIAFIGSTGSGKSTLINLLPRFYDVTSGSITIGGINIKDVSQKELRSRIGYIPQKAILFSGDIESNLRFADENASMDNINTAIEVSQSKEFIDSKKEGIKYNIAQGGTNVSGGQKQRLSIARAITKQPDIYIFDDSFSALDYKTDVALRQALNKLVEQSHAMVFIVAQRISTIMHADKIIVLDEGKMAGIGTHEQLLKNCPVYKEIALSQLSLEELE
ncbi:MAG: ABC transporter ATP-binding protein [Erysipelotrichaceae bacterium]|nr:ABC transporter ATP-binding protein [Erysipelotrichaceae bacterium]MDY5997809.1 ABC transporter ATP-binding protein [Erysipelotrichaceae bacterium]